MKRILIIGVVLVIGLTTARATLIVNGGFEDPPNAVGEPDPTSWTAFANPPTHDAMGVVQTTFAHGGTQVLQFFAPADSSFNNTFHGYLQDTNMIVEGSGGHVDFSAFVRSSPFLPFTNNMTLELKIEFFTNSVALNTIVLSIDADDISTGSWTQFMLSGTPTNNTDRVRFTIVQVNGTNPDDNGILWVDDASATFALPEPSTLGMLLIGGAIVRYVKQRRDRRQPNVETA